MLKVLILFILLNTAGMAQNVERHALFTNLLKDVVEAGSVNYKALKKESRLNEYVLMISEVNPDTIKGEENALAFWINAYNVFTLKVIVDNYPIESINELHAGGRIIGHIIKRTVWDKEFFSINSKVISLNEIEHEIIREEFNEPRIHFALVCAAVSCPKLRNEAYEGFKLEEQLEDQARVFLSAKEKNYFILSERKAYLSKSFDWYGDDFGNNNSEIVKFTAKYLPKNIREDLSLNAGEWEIEYLPYDWILNDYSKGDK